MQRPSKSDEGPANAQGYRLRSMSSRRDEWIRLEEQKRSDLQDAECAEALRINSLDDLQENLHEMVEKFKIRNGIIQKLDPALDHLKSFTQAITSASQYTPVACLVWGGIQAVVEVGVHDPRQADRQLTSAECMHHFLHVR